METARVISIPTTPQPTRIFVEKCGYLTPDEIVKKFYSPKYEGKLNIWKVSDKVIDNPLVQSAIVRFETVKTKAEQKSRWDRNKRIGRKFVNKH